MPQAVLRKAFDGRDVFVKRVICLAADASTLDHR